MKFSPLKIGPLLTAGSLLGMGMGGFVDGILFHQILQTHNMLSAVLPKTTLLNAEINMFWDGLFHALTWTMTALGIALLWRCGHHRDVPWSGRHFSGALLFGWGAFNLVEGLIDHYILGVHHVIESLGLSVWDHVFVGTGAILAAVGGLMIKSRLPVRSSAEA